MSTQTQQPSRGKIGSGIAIAALILLALLALLALLLVLRTNRELSTQVTSLQTRLDRFEAAGVQQAEAARVLEGRVERLQVALKDHEESIRLIRQDADRVGQQAQALQAMQSRLDKVIQQAEALEAVRAQVGTYLGDAQALQAGLARQAEVIKALQGRSDELGTTVTGISKTIEGLNEQLARQQLPGFPLPLFVPVRP